MQLRYQAITLRGRREGKPRSEIDLGAKDIVQVKPSHGRMRGAPDDEARDGPALLHPVEGGGRERVPLDQPRLGRHEVAGADLADGPRAEVQPAEVAIGDDADEPARAVDN